ncbi:class I SAM-dependent methyltransferase [Dapis sp. BLCC M126]|uniref:class I SAM-dependent methyltransferase n=1 Tax=Dapis sp. BLCC M126 TaxID=3400189 RepID=UPI003CEA9457
MAATIEKELEEVKGKWQKTQQELDQTKSELHDVREELERSQSQLDEVLGELEQTHFELHQLKEKGGQQQSESNGEVEQELEETKAKLQETEQLLEQSQSQLGETMGVLEGYQSQMEQTMEVLEESQGKLQQKQEELEQVKAELAQKQSGSDAELQKELEETKSQLRESEELLEQYQSQLEETMEVLEESQSQLKHNQKDLEEVKKDREETKLKLQQTRMELRKLKGDYQAESIIKDLVNVLQETTKEEKIDLPQNFNQGSLHQHQRIARVAEYCVQIWPGDLIEIGCFIGETTKLLAEVAQKYNRRLMAVDPWELGTQNCRGGEYEAFLKNIEPYKANVDIVRLSSLDQKAISLIKNRELCFAFVDGLHTYDACLSDIKTVDHCQGVIAVDDLLWSPEVDSAFHKGAEIIQSRKLYLPICREGYLLPKI